jgi:chitinase
MNPKLKVLLAIGGWNEGSENYSRMSASRDARASFVASVVDLLT